MTSRLRARTLGFALAALGAAAAARAEIRVDGSVEIDGIQVFRDSSPSSGQCYYLPRPEIAVWPDGRPKLSFVKYTKTGNAELTGGFLHIVVRLGLAGDQLARLKARLPAAGLTCATLGPVLFKSGQFAIDSAVAGEGGVFTRKIVGTGKAPLVSGSEAAVSIAVTPEGATLLDKALALGTYPVNVTFNMTYEGLTNKYNARVTINYDAVRNYFEKEARERIVRRYERNVLGIWRDVWYVQVGERQETRVTDVMRTKEFISIEATGDDEQLSALLTTLTDQLMREMHEVSLDLPQTASETGEDAAKQGGGPIPYGSRVKYKGMRRSGTNTIILNSSLRVERDSGPLTTTIGDVLRKFRGDRRVVTIIPLDDPDLQDRQIRLSLDMENAAHFGEYINYVTVAFRKEHPGFDATSGEVVFDRKSFGETGNSLTWLYPRLGERHPSWLNYRYAVTWSLAGGVKVQEDWRISDAPFLTLTPPHKPRQIELSIESANVAERGIRFVVVKLSNRLAGRERIREVRVLPDKETSATYKYFHEDGDFEVRYQITWMLKDGQRIESAWRSTTDPFIDLNYREGTQ
jgi:hypothetical protein